eukprot:TRINITY_DN14285_c1_g1_i1.p1 TRINITY_DN14285_c1_g1~~TRINITY_DN14285_c1_g1_i1.p1  ORF type:complete len:374 (+),score=42.50 TRINITY_DN14285_c1_g1_i1:78-1124(+)
MPPRPSQPRAGRSPSPAACCPPGRQRSSSRNRTSATPSPGIECSPRARFGQVPSTAASTAGSPRAAPPSGVASPKGSQSASPPGSPLGAQPRRSPGGSPHGQSPNATQPQRAFPRGSAAAAAAQPGGGPSAARSRSRSPSASPGGSPSAQPPRCPWEAQLPQWDADLAASGKIGAAAMVASSSDWRDMRARDGDLVDECMRAADRLAASAHRSTEQQRRREDAVAALGLPTTLSASTASAAPSLSASTKGGGKALFGGAGIQADCDNIVSAAQRVNSMSGRVDTLLQDLSPEPSPAASPTAGPQRSPAHSPAGGRSGASSPSGARHQDPGSPSRRLPGQRFASSPTPQ